MNNAINNENKKRNVPDKGTGILNVPTLRFPEFEGEWEKCKVSDLLDFYSTNSLSWDKLEYGTSNIQNLHYGLIHVGLPTMVDVEKDNLPYIIDGNVPKNYELCKDGDVAFADASEDTNEVAKAVEFYNLNGKDVVCGLHTIHGRDNKDKTIVGYKGYAFSSMSFHHQIRRIAQGTKIYSINSKNFCECYIGIPSKKEQRKIADLLRLLDERIATQNALIDRLQSLIKGIMVNLQKRGLEDSSWGKISLCDVLTERKELNKKLYPVFSVSVSQGVINQIEYLGRSFAAKDTSKYHVAHYGDIVYTKSPTGDFPYGIVKQSYNQGNVAVSPLYGVYTPKNFSVGVFLHEYFKSNVNTYNYLHSLIQKGAKNTINITNQHFLENKIAFPLNEVELTNISKMICSLNSKLMLMQQMKKKYEQQKQYLLRQMFI